MQLRPVGVDAHARPKALDRLRRIGADLEGAEVEIAARARRAPAGVFALGADHAHLQRDDAIVQAPAPARSILDAHLEVAQQVLAQIELHPHVVQIDQRDQRDAGQHELAVLDRDAEHLAVGGRHDDHLIDQRLERLAHRPARSRPWPGRSPRSSRVKPATASL